ncbi:hypothetical protein BDV18DRAFT_130681 [Aspergillus unguis]
MPTPERQPGQTSWARRQQQQQNTSPFGRARRDSLHLDVSNDSTSPRESPARQRAKFSRTGTLRGAFNHTSTRLPLSEIEGDIFLPEYARRGSPRQRRQSANVMSSRSNPPELEEAYRQIDEAQSLTDNDDQSDDENVLYTSADKFRRTPTSSSKREQRLSTASESSYTSGSPRRRFSDYTKDEERLKRATTGRSPVFDRNSIGGGQSSEHLQRREWEINNSSEEDDGVEPPVQAPATWGSRARQGDNWMKSLTRNYERGAESTTKEREPSPSRILNEASLRRAQQATGNRDIMDDRPVLSYQRRSPPHDSTDRNGSLLSGGEKIPNTPITHYRDYRAESTFTKRSPTKRDSHELIRKLTRPKSPSQKATESTQTPQPTSTGRRVYDKTPVAPGAWIDTPMTQRAPAPQPREVRDALGSKLDNLWGHNNTIEEEEPTGGDPDPAVSVLEPSKDTVKERPPVEPSKQEAMEEPVLKTQEAEQLKEGFPKSEQVEPKETERKQPQREAEPESDLRGIELETKRNRKREELPLPEHPKSALDSVLQDHENNKERLDVGDDTLESLQAILDQPAGDDTETREKDDANYEQQVIEQLETAQSSQMEINDIERIDGKLQSLADNMSHLRSGLNHLENQMSSHNEQVLASINKRPADKPESKSRPLKTSCETCSTGKDTVVRKGIPLPHLWDQGSNWWTIHPTRLGWSILIPLLWYFLESTMCDYYSHPFVDTTCEGNCLLPDAPRFPFVIPTMLWRWLHLSDILLPLWTIMVAFSRIFAQLLGLSDGYVDDDLPALNLTGKIWIDGTQVSSFGPAATPTITSSTASVAQWAWAREHVPDPLPEITAEANSGGDAWDDISMDDDEFL